MATKKEQREAAKKKAKQTRIMMIALWSAIVLVAVVAIIISVFGGRGETYTDGHASVVLSSNGSFEAELYHHETYEGTYTKTPDSGGFAVTFVTRGGEAYIGFIDGRVLILPEEWQDDHGHGYMLPLK